MPQESNTSSSPKWPPQWVGGLAEEVPRLPSRPARSHSEASPRNGDQVLLEMSVETSSRPLGTAIVGPGQVCPEGVVEFFTELGSSHLRSATVAPAESRAQRLPRVPANRRRPARTNSHRPPDKTCSRSLSTVRPIRPEDASQIAAEAVGWTLSTITCRRSPPGF
jgi:hypothetical protein